MYTLSEEQIAFIYADLQRRGIKNEELKIDLLDHVCCIIEEQLTNTDDFKAFYQKTIQTFYKSELTEIQDEIRILKSNKYYYQMKKLSKPLGFIALGLILIGGLFRYMCWTGGAPIIFVGSVFFNLWLILQFTIAGQTGRSSIMVNILGLLAMVSSVIGALFKIMHWPYAEIVMIVGSVFWFTFIFYLLIRGFRKPAKRTI